MRGLFLTWVQIALETGILLAVLLPLSRWLHRRIPARRLCLVWGILALRLLLPVRIEAEIPVPESVLPSVSQTVQAVPDISENVTTAGSRPIQDAPVPVFPDRQIPQAVESPRAEDTDITPDWLSIGTGIWIAGTAVFTLWETWRYLRFRRQIDRWGCPPQDETTGAYHEICCEMALRTAPELRIWESAPGPMILGLLRPVLILPSEGYSRGTLEAIFRHELVHFRRGDLWYKLLMTAVRAVHWYHPLVWWMVRVSDRDLELSCDEEAVRNGDLEARRQYSMALLDAVRMQKKGGIPVSTQFHHGKREWKLRLANLLAAAPKQGGRAIVAIILAASILCGAWTGCTVRTVPGTGDSGVSAEENIVRLSGLYRYKMVSMETEPQESSIPIVSLVSELPADGLAVQEIDYSQEGGRNLSILYRITDPGKIFVDNTLTADVYYRNAGILFSLVESLEKITISYEEDDKLGQGGTVTYTFSYTRDMYPVDLDAASSSPENFTALLLALGTTGLPESQLEPLYEARTEYLGSASAVGKLVSLLPEIGAASYDGMELSTENQPYRLTLFYIAEDMGAALENEAYSAFYVNSGILLSLIQNLDRVEIQINDPDQETAPEYTFTANSYPAGAKQAWESFDSFAAYWGGGDPPAAPLKADPWRDPSLLREIYRNAPEDSSDAQAVENLLSRFPAFDDLSYADMTLLNSGTGEGDSPSGVLWLFYYSDVRVSRIDSQQFMPLAGMLISLLEDVERVEIVVEDGRYSESFGESTTGYIGDLKEIGAQEETFVEYWSTYGQQ